MGVLQRIPELVCTACKGELVETDAGLDCKSCQAHYDLVDDIPRMLAGMFFFFGLLADQIAAILREIS